MILDGMWSRRTAAISCVSGLKLLLCGVKYWKFTLGEGKSKSPRGESPLQSQGMHPGRREKASHSEVSCHYKIREVTPEEGKSKSLRGESPLQSQGMHPGKWKKQVAQR